MQKIWLSLLILVTSALLFSGYTKHKTLPGKCAPIKPKILFDAEYNQKPEGPERACWPNHFWKKAGQWKDGKRQGVWTYWDQQGQKNKTVTYKNGKIIGFYEKLPESCVPKFPISSNGKQTGSHWICFKPGQWSEATTYINGKRHGISRTWHNNGKRASLTHYKHGKRHGKQWYWDKKGRKKSLITYQAGAPTGTPKYWLPNGKLVGKGYAQVMIQLRNLAKGAQLYYQEHQIGSTGMPLERHLPTLGAPHKFLKTGTYTNPPTKPCAKGKPEYPANPKLWDKQPWKALRFSLRGKHYAQFTYTVRNGQFKKGHPSFVFQAKVDMDCDGKYAIYTLSGHKDHMGEIVFSKLTAQNPGE